MGTTASIGFMRLEGAKRVLYFANVGDSKAFVFGDTVIPLTTDHKPNN
jgi:serine/threonine protein phosphatase PrpC